MIRPKMIRNNKKFYTILLLILFFITLLSLFGNPFTGNPIKDGESEKKLFVGDAIIIPQKPMNPKEITIDILLPFPSSRLNITLEGLKFWSEENHLPCFGGTTLQQHYPGAKANLVFYQNFRRDVANEELIQKALKSFEWVSCFNNVKYVYAQNTLEEDKHPYGISAMFYKYFTIGPPSDYFFWFETDLRPIRNNWLIEVFRTVTTQLDARRNLPFYVLGSNARHPLNHHFEDSPVGMGMTFHLNGNAIYWRDRSWYDSFLQYVERIKYTGNFDIDMYMYMHEYEKWNSVTKIYGEFVIYELMQNLGHLVPHYNEEVFRISNPRTYFVHI